MCLLKRGEHFHTHHHHHHEQFHYNREKHTQSGAKANLAKVGNVVIQGTLKWIMLFVLVMSFAPPGPDEMGGHWEIRPNLIGAFIFKRT